MNLVYEAAAANETTIRVFSFVSDCGLRGARYEVVHQGNIIDARTNGSMSGELADHIGLARSQAETIAEVCVLTPRQRAKRHREWLAANMKAI